MADEFRSATQQLNPSVCWGERFDQELLSDFASQILSSYEPPGRSGCNIPCRGLPQIGHALAFKVISAPQHPQKAATSSTSTKCYAVFDALKKGKDSRWEQVFDLDRYFVSS
jgi:hypothetical protein